MGKYKRSPYNPLSPFDLRNLLNQLAQEERNILWKEIVRLRKIVAKTNDTRK